MITFFIWVIHGQNENFFINFEYFEKHFECNQVENVVINNHYSGLTNTKARTLI